MHLEIKQANDRTEQVSSTCIDKLYNLSKNGLLDATSDLRGSINAASAYEDAVTFLNTIWGPNLIVTASAYYIRFADPEVESVLKTFLNKAEGEGITTQEAASAVFGEAFKNNTDIETFDEYTYFTTQKVNTPNFSGCTSLESIDLTGAIKIPNFSGCTNLEYFYGENSEAGTLSFENVTSTGNLQSCTKLKRIILNSAISTSSNSFLSTSISRIDVDTLEHWLQCQFGVNGNPISASTELYVNGTLLTTLTIPQSISSLSGYLFLNYKKLTSVVLHSGLTLGGISIFANCSNLTSVDFAGMQGTIPTATFQGCSSLLSLNIPSGITSIADRAFYGCSGLTSVTINATTPPTLANTNAFNNTNNCPIYVPAGSVTAYQSASNWSSLASRIQAIPTT